MTIQFHRDKRWKIFDIGVQALTVEGLQHWPLWEEAKSQVVVDTDDSRHFQLAPTDPRQDLAESTSQAHIISQQRSQFCE